MPPPSRMAKLTAKLAVLTAKLAAAQAANETDRVKKLLVRVDKLRAKIKRREQQQASGGVAGATGASLLTPSTLVVDVEMAPPATAATMDNAKAPPGGKSMQWKRAATDTEEGVVKGLPSWPIEGWSVSKHTKKDSAPYFM